MSADGAVLAAEEVLQGQVACAVINVNYFCRFAPTILAGPGLG